MPIVATVKKARLKWLDHIERMQENRTVRRFFGIKPKGQRFKGRLRKRLIDDVKKDLQELGVRDWKKYTNDRGKWEKIVDQGSS